MAMSAERGKIADDVSVSDPQWVRTVSQRSNATSGSRRLEFPILFYMKVHKAFVRKLSKQSLGKTL